jgi:putative transposase
VQTETGRLAIAVARDRHGSCEPQRVPKRQRRLDGCDATGLALSARGLSPRAMPGPLAERYGTEVAPTRLSPIPEAVWDAGRPWPARPRASVSPSLSLEAWLVPSRQAGPVPTQAVALALGRPMDGEQARLGVGRSERAGAPGGLSVFTERHTRGVQDGLSACVEGLTGLPEALEAGCPTTQVPLGMVQKVRHRLRDGPWRARRAVATALRAISGAAPLADAAHALERCAERWDATSPALSPSWRADGERWTVRLDSPPALRRGISTTNAIESLHDALRKVRQGRGAFPHAEAIVKRLSMGLQHVTQKWTQPIPAWQAALKQCGILFGERVPV